MRTKEYLFHHPIAFWFGCILITFGVLSHLPMFVHASHMNFHMAGMPMDNTMLIGMAMIPFGLAFSCYGLMPRLATLRVNNNTEVIQFHVADNSPLNKEHIKLVIALLIAVIVDVMKPATLGFVMPGMTHEYKISSEAVGTVALIALTGTAIGSVLWGRMADVLGRRASILLSALMFIGTAICGAMPSFQWNLIMCFLMGLSAGGLLPITFTLMAEMIPAHHRGWLLVALGGIGTSVGYLVASGAAAILEPLFSWRALWLLGLPTGLLVIMLNKYIPESPRFLANAGLIKQAKAVLHKYNGELDEPTQTPSENHLEIEKTSFYEIMRKPYGMITLALIGTGTAWGLVNFGFLLWLPTNLRDMGMSADTTNGLLAQSGLFALPGIFAVIWLYHSWSSIKTLVLFVMLTSLSLICFVLSDFLGQINNTMIILSTVLLLISSSGVIAMLIPYAAEIYPVQHRGIGAGLIAASSKVGGIIGALLGVAGFFEQIGLSAFILAIPLSLCAYILLKNGIDTRGRRLEEIHGDLINRI
ncbi:MFS transporter [Thalassotalea profundi]|uniref:MFS transporter n=1 Tax=Thalassotalea profundi TaxID=2036687 RepID=A0ABQ3IMR1_9GAMM|nr:MFS transporter [Thalassotalea profundi]GHE88173.1 MFS transporter [Thalassotalea profundi]